MSKFPSIIDKNNVKDFLNSFDTFMTDCDGVLWHGNEVLHQANQVVNKLQTMGKKIIFVTNNSTKSREEFAEKCLQLGFEVGKENILSSSYALAYYLKQHNFSKKVYVVGSPGIAQELDAVGVQHIGVGPDPMVGSPWDLIESVELDKTVGAVAVAFDGHISLPKILKAASYIHTVPDCLFLASNTDENFPCKGSNIIYPGTGCMVRAIETVVGRQALVMGKPEPRMLEVVQEQHNVQPERTLMVGDRCNTDILLGSRCGMHTLMVLTGVHKLEDVQRFIESEDPADQLLVPKWYLPSLGELLNVLD